MSWAGKEIVTCSYQHCFHDNHIFSPSKSPMDEELGGKRNMILNSPIE